MFSPEINQKIGELVASWPTTEASERVNALESYGQAHGFAEFNGLSIPTLIEEILINYTDWFLENEGEDARDEHFIYMNRLLLQLQGYFFGRLDPRWHATKAELEIALDKIV